MREPVPLGDESEDLGLEIGEVFEVGSGHPLAPENREPLLDLIHPRAMDGREVEAKARMALQSGADQLAVVGAEVLGDDVNERDRRWRVAIDLFEQIDELELSLSSPTDPDDLAPSECRWRRADAGRPCARARAGAAQGNRAAAVELRSCAFWLQRSLLVRAEDALKGQERPRVQVTQIQDLLLERFVARRLGAEPMMDPPRFESMRSQDPLHSLRRDALDDGRFAQ